MQKILLVVCAALLCGCATQKRGKSRVDVFESTRVDQMTGNNVSGMVFQRTLFCLNARRETRRVLGETNLVVTLHTNRSVSYITNTYAVTATNAVTATATNQLPPAPLIVSSTNEESAPLVSTHAAPEPMTNSAVTRTSDDVLTTSSGNHQAAVSMNTQSSVAFNDQVTVTHSNLAINFTSSRVIRSETNQTITAVTNFLVSTVTNEVILSTNRLVYDQFLYTELTPPPDFMLAPGESLVVLADGERFAYAPTTTTAAGFGRPGFMCTLYKVTPEVLVAIANAREVKVRLRGANSHIERQMSRACRKRFKKFLLKYYTAEPARDELLLRSLDAKAPTQQPPKSSSISL